MEMKRLSGGNLRAAGYDAAERMLVVELTSGTFEYGGVSADTFRRLLVGVVAVELLPRQYRRGISGEAHPLDAPRRSPEPGANAHAGGRCYVRAISRCPTLLDRQLAARSGRLLHRA